MAFKEFWGGKGVFSCFMFLEIEPVDEVEYFQGILGQERYVFMFSEAVPLWTRCYHTPPLPSQIANVTVRARPLGLSFVKFCAIPKFLYGIPFLVFCKTASWPSSVRTAPFEVSHTG